MAKFEVDNVYYPKDIDAPGMAPCDNPEGLPDPPFKSRTDETGALYLFSELRRGAHVLKGIGIKIDLKKRYTSDELLQRGCTCEGCLRSDGRTIKIYSDPLGQTHKFKDCDNGQLWPLPK